MEDHKCTCGGCLEYSHSETEHTGHTDQTGERLLICDVYCCDECRETEEVRPAEKTII